MNGDNKMVSNRENPGINEIQARRKIAAPQIDDLNRERKIELKNQKIGKYCGFLGEKDIL